MQRKYKELYTILNLANEKDLDDKSNGSITNPFYNINHFYGSTSFLFFPLASMIIIATGSPHSTGKNTELFDVELSGNAKVCQNQDFPIQVWAATGGVIEENKVLICGGYSSDSSSATDECYVLGNKVNVPVKMSEKRRYAASIAFNGRLYVAGGLNENNARLQSTEWIDVHEGATTGGDLPMPLSGHSMEVVQTLPSLTVMLIGGYSDDFSSKTYLGNPENPIIEWKEGPDLMTPRSFHASSIINEEEGRFIIVTGGQTTGFTLTNTVEFLELTSSSPENWTWRPGKLFLLFFIDAYVLFVVLTFHC